MSMPILMISHGAHEVRWTSVLRRPEWNGDGADVHPIDGLGKRSGWGYSCRTMEVALKKKDELLKKYPKVAVRDNATRKEKVYEQKLAI